MRFTEENIRLAYVDRVAHPALSRICCKEVFWRMGLTRIPRTDDFLDWRLTLKMGLFTPKADRWESFFRAFGKRKNESQSAFLTRKYGKETAFEIEQLLSMRFRLPEEDEPARYPTD